MHYYTSNCVSGTQIHFWIYITVLRRFVPKYYYSASPQKSPLFMLCSLLHFHAYEPFERNMCTKVSCHLPSQKCYQNGSFPRTNIVNLWLIGKPWKILVEVQKVFVMQLALFACKKCSFFTSIHNVHNKRQGPKSYICTGLLLSPSLSKEMEQSRVGSIGIPTSISICTTTTTSTTKCNQKRYYYYYMSNPFLN